MIHDELVSAWPELAAFFDGDNLPWRTDVAAWNHVWRRCWSGIAEQLQDEGMSFREAEEEAYRRILARKADPVGTASRLVGGGAVVKDAVDRPKMPTRRARKSTREGLPSLFDGMDDGGSTTYMKED